MNMYDEHGQKALCCCPVNKNTKQKQRKMKIQKRIKENKKMKQIKRLQFGYGRIGAVMMYNKQIEINE